MSKVAQYLNEHLLGEATTADAVRERFATDASILRIVPDMVVHPRTTADIRKVARFSWQLSEKGHTLPITARGGGSDQTGAAIGQGVIVNTLAHMNQVFEIDVKQRLVRVQPGVTFKALNDALALHNLMIPSFPASESYSTIGGAIANNASGVLSGQYGPTGEWVSQLEVVLANGDVLQTGKISKRELGRKMAQQNFEGEIYRNLDKLFEENAELLSSLTNDVRDNVGYNITDVRYKDGSIDLTPLFVGSQGTLGIVSEIIMKSTERMTEPLVGALAFSNYESLRDGLDALRALDPTVLELIDARLFEQAAAYGKRYPFYADAVGESGVAAVVLIEFHDNSGRAKNNAGKRIAKMFKENSDVVVAIEQNADKVAELRALRDVTSLTSGADKAGVSAPPILDGAYIPPERFEDFAGAVGELEKHHHVVLALYGHAGQHVYYARPQFNFTKVGDRQRVMKLLADWSTIVASHGGHIIGEAGEGRLKAVFAYKNVDAEVRALYDAVKLIFDPQEILNTGAKQPGDIKQIVGAIRSDYDGSDYATYAPSN